MPIVRTRANPLYYDTGKFMEWLLIGVFTFFGIHTLLWLIRSLVERSRRAPAARGDRH